MTGIGIGNGSRRKIQKTVVRSGMEGGDGEKEQEREWGKCMASNGGPSTV
jgi:hypothetical protein